MYLFLQSLIISSISKKLTILFFCLGLLACYSQNVTIRGRAHSSYARKIISLYTVSDLITNQRFKETQDTIQADGFFELAYQTAFTRPVFLKIENVTAQLYTQPDYVYGITVPEVETALDYKNDAELPVNIGIIGTDSTELNALTFDFQKEYNQLFAPNDKRFISRAVMFKLADSLKKRCDIKYTGIKNEYFKNYVNYSIASVNASVSRGEGYLINGYILRKPIQYNHYEYMNFFNACFKGYLNSVSSQHKGQSLYNIINSKVSYTLLCDFLKEDKLVKNDTLKELIVLNSLWEFYFNPEFEQNAIVSIVSQLNKTTKVSEHKRISAAMLTYFNNMQPGTVAPLFSARSRDGKMASLNSYKGRWLYLNFFSTANPESMREMGKIAALKKKYGHKVTFISVCLDDSLQAYNLFFKNNPRCDWPVWYNSSKGLTKTAKEQYAVSGTEAYFLINNLGYLSQSPALSPSGGIEYRFNVIFKIKQRGNKIGIR